MNSKVQTRTTVSTRTRVAIAAGAIGVAAAALVGSFTMGQGKVTVSLLSASRKPISGNATFQADVRPPSGYGVSSVMFYELPQQRSYSGTYVPPAVQGGTVGRTTVKPNVSTYRTTIDTMKLRDGKHEIYAQVVFIRNVSSTGTATSPLTMTVTIPSTGTATSPSSSHIVTSSAKLAFTVSNAPAIVRAPVTVTVPTGDASLAPAYVIGGASNVLLSKYTFKATEAVQIKKLTILVEQTGVESLTLQNSAGAVLAGPVAVTGANDATFSNLTLSIAKDASTTISVFAKLQSVGGAGMPTGTSLRTYLLDVPTTVEIRGTSNNMIYNAFANTGAFIGPYRVAKKSTPVVSLSALPTSTLQDGDQTVLRSTISANAAGDVAVKGITLEVRNTSTAATIYPTGTGAVRMQGVVISTESSLNNGTCQAKTTCMWHVLFSNELVIPAGTSRTLDFRLAALGTATGDSVGVRILGDTSYTVPTSLSRDASGFFGYRINGIPSYFTWSDMSVVAHSDALGGSADWSNGQYVRIIPTDFQTRNR